MLIQYPLTTVADFTRQCADNPCLYFLQVMEQYFGVALGNRYVATCRNLPISPLEVEDDAVLLIDTAIILLRSYAIKNPLKKHPPKMSTTLVPPFTIVVTVAVSLASI